MKENLTCTDCPHTYCEDNPIGRVQIDEEKETVAPKLLRVSTCRLVKKILDLIK